jgi:hypothetical protein
MKKLSESLMDLAGRVKGLEASATAVQEKNRAALQARREQLETAIEREKRDIEEATAEAKEEARSWWSDTKASIERQVAEMRGDFEKWQAGLKEKNAEQAAKDAEDDAVVAVTLATYCLDAAEWAVVRAELARGQADELAGQR